MLSQAGIFQPAMRLQVTPDARVRFSVPTGHPNSGFGTVESEAGAVTEQVWHHLAAVLDLHAGEARVYLNGEPAGVAGAGPAPWRADGPMFIGVAGTADDASSQPIHGVIDRIGAWSSALHPDVIFSKGRTGGVPTFPCF